MTPAASRWVSGFCGAGNPPDSHERCRVTAHTPSGELACACPCHAPQEDDSPPAARLGVFDDLAEEAYHRDPTSVSASGMKTLLRSPAHFLHERTHPKESDSMDLGSVAHAMVLGAGCEYVAVEGNRNRNDVKDAIAEARAAGKVVLKPEQLAAAERMADAVLTHRLASRLLTSPGRSEVSLFWEDPDYNVIRRCRWDRLGDDGLGVDLKTTANAEPAALERHVIDYRYEMAACWYSAVTLGLGIDLAAFALVWVESSEPHAVVVTELSEEMWVRGFKLVEKALTTYRRCLDTGEWPGYWPEDGSKTLAVPGWVKDVA